MIGKWLVRERKNDEEGERYGELVKVLYYKKEKKEKETRVEGIKQIKLISKKNNLQKHIKF